MELQKELQSSSSNTDWRKIASKVKQNRKNFALLIKVFLSSDHRTSHKAANVIMECLKAYPKWISTYVNSFINTLQSTPLIGIKRNILRILQNHQFTEDQSATMLDLCFGYLETNKEPIAIKAFSITILQNICLTIPELKRELIIILEDLLAFDHSPAVQFRGKKALKKLNNN